MSHTRVLFVAFSHAHTARALRDLLELVRRHEGEVCVLGVVPPAPTLQRLLTPRSTTEQVEAALHDAVRTELTDAVKRATGSAHPPDVSIEVVTGHVIAETLHRTVEHDHDLVAVTSDPDDPAARAVVARLQRKSPVPVWAMRPDRSRRRWVLAAVDTDPDHHGLDHRILDAAGWLLRPGDELHVMTAWELLGEATLRDSPFLGEGRETVNELRERCESEHRAALDALLAEHDFADVDLHVHVENGQAPDLIVELVRRAKINQLVLGTIGRTGIPGFVVGNTAEQLLGEVPCSELVVKPPGFVSPFTG